MDRLEKARNYNSPGANLLLALIAKSCADIGQSLSAINQPETYIIWEHTKHWNIRNTPRTPALTVENTWE